MCESERKKALLEVIRRGLELYGQKQTEAQLGDRSTYLGMSDIARYADCPRAAVAGKLGEVDTSLERLLTLQRGHWFEDGIAGSLSAAGLRFMRQVEICDPYGGVPIRAHGHGPRVGKAKAYRAGARNQEHGDVAQEPL